MKKIPFDPFNPDHNDPTKFTAFPGTVFDHVIAAIKASPSTDPITNLSVAFHDLGKATTFSETPEGKPQYKGHESELHLIDAICDRLKFSNKDREAMKFAMEHHMKAHRLQDMNRGKVLSLRQDPNWKHLKDTMYSDEASRGAPLFDPIAFQKKLDYVEDLFVKMGETAAFEAKLSALIDGRLIMSLRPGINGKDIGRIKDAVRQVIVDKEFNISADEVRDLILKY